MKRALAALARPSLVLGAALALTTPTVAVAAPSGRVAPPARASATTRSRLRSGAPLLDIGGTRRAPAGSFITLSGSEPRAARGSRLRYRWTVLQQPRGPQALLLAGTTRRLRFRPAAPGHYVLRLTVAGPGHSSTYRDIQVAATQPNTPIGIPLATTVPNGGSAPGGTVLQYNGSSYALPANDAVFVAIIDPQTGTARTSTYGADPQSAKSALSSIETYASGAPDPIVALVADQGVQSEWEKVVEKVAGFGTNDLNSTAGDGWSVVGDPTTSTGTVNNALLSSNDGSISGLVQNQPALGRFAFVTGAYLSYETQAAGSSEFVDVMNIPTPSVSTFTSQDVRAGCAAGTSVAAGFHLLTLDAVSMQELSERTITTSCNGSLDTGGVSQLITSLKNAAEASSGNRPGFGIELVFLQSIGTDPIPAGSLQAVPATAEELGDAIAGVGGNPSAFLQPLSVDQTGLPYTGEAPPSHYALAGGAYALLDGVTKGTLPAAEANSALAAPNHDHEGNALWGTLRRGTRFQYEPATATAVAPNTADLDTVAYQAPTPWPYTGQGSTPEQGAAFHYISESVLSAVYPAGQYPEGSCVQAGESFTAASADLRQLYCDSTLSFGTISGDVGQVTYSQNASFSQATFEAVRKGLEVELTWVANVHNLCRQLAAAYAGGLTQKAQIDAVVANVQNAVDIQGKVAGTWLSIMANELNLASALGYLGIEEDLQYWPGAINLLSAAGYSGSDALSNTNFDLDAEDLAAQAQARGTAIGQQIRAMAPIFATDYGKLKALSTLGFADNDKNRRVAEVMFGRWATSQLVPLVLRVRWVNGGALKLRSDLPFTCDTSTNFPYQNTFFASQSARGEFAVGRRMYLAGERPFPNNSDAEVLDIGGPVPSKLYNFLFKPFAIEANGNISAFGFTKQDFFWPMVSGPFDCVR